MGQVDENPVKNPAFCSKIALFTLAEIPAIRAKCAVIEKGPTEFDRTIHHL
ncbi:MAG: hypothetical protein WEB58_13840 [Planctomycetaceae bacterium]